MATFLISPASLASHAHSGVHSALVNAADASAALLRARALPGYSSGMDASFAPSSAWTVTLLSTENSSREFLIEGRPLLPGTHRRGGGLTPS